MTIELAIREYLISNGISQAFVARKCGWSKQRINAILTGKQEIKAGEYGRLCDAVGVPYDYFFIAAAQDSIQSSA